MIPTKAYGPQLFFRIALAGAFLSAVADRLGLWGKPGAPGVSWGNWQNFVSYTKLLTPIFPEALAGMFALTATALEVVFALMLLAGFKTRLAATGAGVLLVLFACFMVTAVGIKPTMDYSVWIGAAGCFLLAQADNYKFTIDNLLNT